MRPLSIAAVALATGALAFAGAADAHGKKHKKYKHHRHHAERVVVHPTYYVAGQRLPRSYYTNRVYYVEPRTYSLAPPPYGYEYVRVGNRIYLTQTETGLISQVLSGLLR